MKNISWTIIYVYKYLLLYFKNIDASVIKKTRAYMSLANMMFNKYRVVNKIVIRIYSLI